MILEKSTAIIQGLKLENKTVCENNSYLQDKYNKLLEKYNSSLEGKVEIDSKLLKLRNELSELKAKNFKLSSEKWVSPERTLAEIDEKDKTVSSCSSKIDTNFAILHKKNYKAINDKLEAIKFKTECNSPTNFESFLRSSNDGFERINKISQIRKSQLDKELSNLVEKKDCSLNKRFSNIGKKEPSIKNSKHIECTIPQYSRNFFIQQNSNNEEQSLVVAEDCNKKTNSQNMKSYKTAEVTKKRHKEDKEIHSSKDTEFYDEKLIKKQKFSKSKSRKKNDLNLSYSNISFKAPTYQVLNNVQSLSKELPPSKSGISMRRFTMSSAKNNSTYDGQFLFGAKLNKKSNEDSKKLSKVCHDISIGIDYNKSAEIIDKNSSISKGTESIRLNVNINPLKRDEHNPKNYKPKSNLMSKLEILGYQQTTRMQQTKETLD